jgi:hypothetical protein
MMRVASAQERPGAAFRGTSSPGNVRQHVTADSRSVGRGRTTRLADHQTPNHMSVTHLT